jgi:DNA-binding transcriptional ArsR family regulator
MTWTRISNPLWPGSRQATKVVVRTVVLFERGYSLSDLFESHQGERSDALPPDIMARQADAAAALLKAMSHQGRLMTLCHLSSGEKSVTELEELLGARQAAVSQQLARLRLDGLVSTRREGKAIYYSITDERASKLMEVIYDLFCRQP